MDSSKYNRSIPLNCPTCGGQDFSSSDEDEMKKCTNCNLELTHDDLISRNQENIDAHLNEVKQEVAEDFKKQFVASLSNAFRGSKNIKIR